jgi:uncharacterized membrane protein YqjE
MEQPPVTEVGMFASLRRMFDTVLALVQNRFQLFTVELQEEKVRLIDLLLRVAAVVVLGIMTLVTATAVIVVWLWNTSPVVVLIIITVLYGGSAAGIGYSIQRRLRSGSMPFAGTLAEFKKDRECLGKRN